MKLFLLLAYIIGAKAAAIKSTEYSSKGMIPSYDKTPVETLEIPDILQREFEKPIIPINPKSATNNETNRL